MADVITAYQNALREVDRASKEAARLAKIVEEAGRALTYWGRVMVVNSPGGIYPPRIANAPYTSRIDAGTWPTAEQIHKALVAYHEARTAQQSAWDAIPEADRVGLTPPSPT